MIDHLKKFERWILQALIVMIAFVILVSTVELGWIIIEDLLAPPLLLQAIPDLKEIFGFFLMVLIGIELLETMKAYLVENIVHVEIILEVALIAIARKVIILDFEKYDGLTVLGTAGLIVAAAAAFYAIKRRMPSRAGSAETHP